MKTDTMRARDSFGAVIQPVGAASYSADFALGDRVWIDGDHSIVAVVTGLMWRGLRAEIEVVWFVNGVQNSLWAPEWRLMRATE